MALIKALSNMSISNLEITRYDTTRNGANIPITKGIDNKALVFCGSSNDGGTVKIQASDDGSSYSDVYSYNCNGSYYDPFTIDFNTHPYWRIYCAAASANYPSSRGIIITVTG